MPLRDVIRVMVVDDTSVSRALIVQALEAMRVRNIEHARDGQSALRALVGRPAHLVLSDHNMPGMSGLDLLKALRTTPSTAKIGFILITGRPDRDLIAQGQKLGMNNFIAKPFTTQSLRGCIEDVVGPI